jgi:hypothetical protein
MYRYIVDASGHISAFEYIIYVSGDAINTYTCSISQIPVGRAVPGINTGCSLLYMFHL